MRLTLPLAGALLAFAGAALAQDTSVEMRPLVDFVLPILLTIISAIIAVGLPILIDKAAKKFGLQIEQSKRDALQVALTNAAAGLVQDLGDKARDLRLEMRNPKVAAAVNRVVRSSPDALRWAGLTEDEIARRILEKIPQLPAPATLR